MPVQNLLLDTSVLPTDALFFYDDDFYQMMEKIAGLGEAKLLEAQGVRSAYSFLNMDDVFDVLSISGSALNDIKKLTCLQADDKSFMVKPGCRSNIRYLYQLLNQKHEEYLRPYPPPSKTDFRYSRRDLSETFHECWAHKSKLPRFILPF